MSLDIKDTILMPDIQKIISGHKYKYYREFTTEFQLHTVDEDIITHTGMTIYSMRVMRDYVNNYGDYIEVGVLCPMGTFIHDIFPYIDNLEATVTMNRQLTTRGEVFVKKDRYKCVYLSDKNADISTNITGTKGDLNTLAPISIKFQLVDKGLELFRTLGVQGCFDSRTSDNPPDIKSFLQSLIAQKSKGITIEKKPIIDRIVIEDPDNTDPIGSLVVPSGTKVIDLPLWLQFKSMGVYNADIGIYLQSSCVDNENTYKTLYIYSLYNGFKYNKADYRMLVYSPITSNYSFSECTYKMEDDVLRVLSTSIQDIPDFNATAISDGTGFRTANALVMMDQPVEITPDGPRFNRSKMNTEIMDSERPDGVVNAVYSGITANNFKISSKIMKNMGVIVKAHVGSMDPDYIQPGMAVKITYEDGKGRLTTMLGVAIYSVTNYDTVESNLITTFNKGSSLLSASTVIGIHVNAGAKNDE